MKELAIYQLPDLELECGRTLRGAHLAYIVKGLPIGQAPIIWICHAITANADPEDWWGGLVGQGKLFDPAGYTIISANILGSCYGSSFAGDINPETGELYGTEWPLVTVRDHVLALDFLRQHLQISRISLCIGASLGGQHVLEWAIVSPELFDKICVISANAQHSPWAIAFNEAQRMALEADCTLYDVSHPEMGWRGMSAARAIGMLSFRNYKTYKNSQSDEKEVLESHKASSYQRYQGLKLSKRFHPWAYLSLTKMMDSHHVGRGRGGIDAALSAVKAHTMIMGIESDLLFPLDEQRLLARKIPGAFLRIINSNYGHDGFLIEYDVLTREIAEFLEED